MNIRDTQQQLDKDWALKRAKAHDEYYTALRNGTPIVKYSEETQKLIDELRHRDKITEEEKEDTFQYKMDVTCEFLIILLIIIKISLVISTIII